MIRIEMEYRGNTTYARWGLHSASGRTGALAVSTLLEAMTKKEGAISGKPWATCDGTLSGIVGENTRKRRKPRSTPALEVLPLVGGGMNE
jgi:hypothetical protein